MKSSRVLHTFLVYLHVACTTPSYYESVVVCAPMSNCRKGNAGSELVCASDAWTGEQALNTLREGAFDAVVLAPGLRDGLGAAVLGWLREPYRGQQKYPVWLVISALDREEAVGQYGPLGNRFLAKPFNLWVLVRRLEELLEAKQGRTQP